MIMSTSVKLFSSNKCVRFILLSLMIMFSFVACEKAKEIATQQAEDIVITIMTNGRWVVDQFSASGVNVKPEFDGYEFQFLRDGTVEAIKGTEITKGTWKASQLNMTINAAFPTGNNTLKRLNYLWFITKSSVTSVDAKVEEAGYMANMRLIKK